MELQKHKEEFENIVKKYKLDEQDKAQEIANFLTKGNSISYKEFATLFAMSEDEAKTFLSFIQKGIEYKEEHIDKNKK